MKIIETISNTRLLILMTALLMVSGISAFMTLPRAEDPVIINRYANITLLLVSPAPVSSVLKP